MGYVSAVGDTRYDQVVRRASEAEKIISSLRTLKSDRVCVVAGSTWPADEDTLLSGLSRIYQEGIPLWTVIVPHEPSPVHSGALEGKCAGRGLTVQLLSEFDEGEVAEATDILIVDRIGILASVYALGDVTYVGGGFGFGIHSVLEPAAQGKVVLFGPRCHKSYEAGLLLTRGVGIVVRNGEEVYETLHSLLNEPEHREVLGRRAESLVQENVGATERIVNHIENIISVS
jgi:3-deoxy-D-manno-octulosonic-acid transferase